MKLNDALSRTSWQDFEILVANRYRRHGWEVAHCGEGRSGFRTGGEVDLRMRKDGKLALVQCGHESFLRLDVGTVERLIAAAREEQADEVIVITTGDVPEDARQVCIDGGAQVIEGAAVRDLLDDDLLDLRPMRAVADIDLRPAQIITDGKLPRARPPGWRLPLFFAALAAMALLAVYGATLARSRLDHPLPPQVDQAVLNGGHTPD
jgi:hypothetical protein